MTWPPAGLPACWRGRRHAVLLHGALGDGQRLCATLACWAADGERSAGLTVVLLAAELPARAPWVAAGSAAAHGAAQDPRQELAQELARLWPVPVPGTHLVALHGGRVRVLLLVGEPARTLRELVARVDAFDLTGLPAPWHGPALTRLAAPLAVAWLPGATAGARHVTATTDAAAATDAVGAADTTHAAYTLRAAGWRITPDGRVAHAPPHLARLPPPTPPPRSVLVVGAGLAGAACARALAVQGVAVTVLEATLPASGASGNPAGLVHGVVHAHDGAHAQLLRAAALHLARVWPALGAVVPGDLGGLLRLDATDTGAARHAPDGTSETSAAHGDPGADANEAADVPSPRQSPAASHWPAAYAQRLTQAQAAAHAGTPLLRGATLYPQGGWLAPPALVAAWLATPGITLATGQPVQALQATPTGWAALDAQGAPLAQADAVVVAAAAGSQELLAPHSALGEARAGTPLLGNTRGQLSWWPQWPGAAADSSSFANSPPPRGNGSPLKTAADPSDPAGASATLGTPVASRLPQPPQLPVTGGAYAMASPGGGLLCGATSQRVPLAEVGQDVQTRSVDHAVNLARSAALLGWPALPEAEQAALAAQAHGRVAWRLHTDDRLPLAGPLPQPWAALQGAARLTQPLRVPAVAGLYACTALGGRGLTLAALLGEVLAAQLLGLPAPLPAPLLAAISPQRWVARGAARSMARAGSASVHTDQSP